MAQITDLNVSPYYDDFDKNDNFQKFLKMSKENIHILITGQGKFKEYNDLKNELELK